MPWSEWQENTQDYYLTNTTYMLSPDGSRADVTSASSVESHSSVVVYGDGVTVNPYTKSRRAVAAVLDPAYRTAFDWYPPALWDMNEGVDYGVRPDRTSDDDDAYVQYESGQEVTHTHWRVPGGSGTWQTGLVAMDSEPPPPGFGQLLLLPREMAPGEDWPIFDSPSGITHSVFGLPSPGLGEFTIPDGQVDLTPPAMSAFLLDSVYDSGAPFPVPSPGHEMSRQINLPGFRVQPEPYGRMPRWRYWIPGPSEPLPLRQRQRDDNLALGVGRWRRGTSRQRSIRWAGYL